MTISHPRECRYIILLALCCIKFSFLTNLKHSSKESISFAPPRFEYRTMNCKQLLFIVVLSGLANSAPTNTSCSSISKPTCIDLMIPVTATANNTLLPTYPNSTSPTAFYEYFASLNFSNIPSFTNTISGTFNISATYCEPTIKVDGRNAVQILVHGVAYTKVFRRILTSRPRLIQDSLIGVVSNIQIQILLENIAGFPRLNLKATLLSQSTGSEMVHPYTLIP